VSNPVIRSERAGAALTDEARQGALSAAFSSERAVGLLVRYIAANRTGA
jgi:hypothetical protein